MRQYKISDLYDRPWFLVIGDSGSGKSAIIENSGFTASNNNSLPINLDNISQCPSIKLWPNDEAVFIETSGDYLNENISDNSDRWQDYILALRRLRPKLPFNSIIITICPADLFLYDLIERDNFAALLYKRLQDIDKIYQSRLPVYIFLTKLDLMPGFSECFSGLDAGEADQCLGWTFAYDDIDKAAPIADFSVQYTNLVTRLSGRVANLLLRYPDKTGSAKLFCLPAQMTAYLPMLERFFKQIFVTVPRRPLLRGIYLTSTMPESLTPHAFSLDVLLPLIRSRFAGFIPTNEAIKEGWTLYTRPSYFVVQPMQKIILGEAGLISNSHEFYRRPFLIIKVMKIAIITTFLILMAIITTSYSNNALILKTMPHDLARFNANATNLTTDIELLHLLDKAANKLPPSFPSTLWLTKMTSLIKQEPIFFSSSYWQAINGYKINLIAHHILPLLLNHLQNQMVNFHQPSPALEQDLIIYMAGSNHSKYQGDQLISWLSGIALIPKSNPERSFLISQITNYLSKRLPLWQIDKSFADMINAHLNSADYLP